MKDRNKLFFILVLISFLLSCENKFPGYEKIDNQFYMKLVSFEDNEKTYDKNNYVSAFIQIREQGVLKYTREASVIFDSDNTNFIDFFPLLKEGDSAIFMVSSTYLQQNQSKVNLPSFEEEYLELSIKIHHYFNQDQYREYLVQNDPEMMEQVLLKKYLRANNIDESFFYDGVYKIVEQKGWGTVIKKGRQVQLKYTGTFIDDVEFDRTESPDCLEFNYGTPNQVIQGLEIALKGMKKGEKSKIIIPSHFAFGEEGSNTGIVPPFTTLIYNLEIINVQ